VAQQQNWQSYSHPSQPSESKAGPTLGVMGGGCAVLIGLILLLAFFLPWVPFWSDGDSGYEMLKWVRPGELFGEMPGEENTSTSLLNDLIASSSALAGCGSVMFGLGLAVSAFVARRNGAFTAWMATSVGGMVILGAFWPCILLASAAAYDFVEEFKIGYWFTLGGALLLVIPAFIGLVSAFLAQRQRS